MKRFAWALVVLVMLICDAQANEWQVDNVRSTLTFVGEQSGEKFEGGFKSFAAQVVLDPDHPEGGKIAVTVDITSAYAGSSDRDAMLPQKDWFDAAKFPQAKFTSTAIRKTGTGKYEVDATLTLKGVSRAVTLPFTLLPEGDHWRAQGHVVLTRSDFGVGLGMFTAEDYVKKAVDVAVNLVAKSVP
jgi:polyisoprenoid-binding protein YceI